MQYHVFDMDDTLFTHDPSVLKIKVKDKNHEIVHELSTLGFDKYEIPENCYFDWGDFRSAAIFEKSCQPIQPMIDKMIKLHEDGHLVEILTARADFDNQKLFSDTLMYYGIDTEKIHVRRSGNLKLFLNNSGRSLDSAKCKAIFLETLLKSHRDNNIVIKKVHFYDDSLKNINAMLEHFKHTDLIQAYRVVHR